MANCRILLNMPFRDIDDGYVSNPIIVSHAPKSLITRRGMALLANTKGGQQEVDLTDPQLRAFLYNLASSGMFTPGSFRGVQYSFS